MRIEQETKLDFNNVLIRPKRSTLQSRKDVDLEREFTFLHSRRKWKGIPIIASNMDTTGTFAMAKTLSKYKMITTLHKFYTINQLEEFFTNFDDPDYVAYSLGIREEDFTKFKEIIKRGMGVKFNFICLDVPNAYLEMFIEKLKELRTLCPYHTIIAGNVVTNEMTEELLLMGADIVKIGIGSGSSCLTRRKAGIGYPQLSAVIECADAAHGISKKEKGYGLIISDGGSVYPSCISKAFCGGADFVMCGSLFAGFDQSGGSIVEKNGKKYKEYYGMSSTKAMEKHYGTKENYRASEGRELKIAYKGDVNFFVEDLFGSLRSTGTYIGARKLKEFSKRATFIKVSQQVNGSLKKYEESG
jgi:GMP reductase